MGIVYLGWDARLGRRVALKTLRAELARDAEYRERFLREARAAAALSHPNVTQIYFIGEEATQPFFAMEFLEGKSLEAILREEGKLPSTRAIDLVRQAAVGLKAAAARGIIHRDIKPSNLVLTADGTLKISDFGLAKMVVADASLTMAGEVLGSPNYLAPEQASGGAVDLRTDVYALGATLYELVTGRPPFDGPTPVSIILKHVREPLRSPRQLNPDLPIPVANLIQRMLAKRKEDRPRDYEVLLRELDRTRTLAEGARDGDLPAASPPPAPRSGSLTWLVVPVLFLLLAAGLGYVRHLKAKARAEASPAPAAAEPPGPGTTGGETRILTSSTEVAPPALAPRGIRGGLRISPRLPQNREAGRASLQFVENTHEITADGKLRVMGTVANTGAGGASTIRVRITLSGPAGEPLESTEVPLTPSLLGPRQSGTFEVFFPDPHQEVGIRTELNWTS